MAWWKVDFLFFGLLFVLSFSVKVEVYYTLNVFVLYAQTQFPLYTLMVFNEWHNGVPVAFILTSKCAEVNLTLWMKALNARMVVEKPNWKPTTFIVDCAQGEINAIK